MADERVIEELADAVYWLSRAVEDLARREQHAQAEKWAKLALRKASPHRSG
jgi:hypothetical protein